MLIIGSISADTIGRLSAFADNRRRYHNLQLSLSADRKKIPISLPLVPVELPLHGEPPLKPLDRVMVPTPQFVEQDPHPPQPDHAPSTWIEII